MEREIALSTGQIVHVDASAGLQSVYPGNGRRPLFQSAWTASGPKVIRAQQRVAFLGDPGTLIDPHTGPSPLEERQPSVVTVLPSTSGLIALALVALYSIQQEAPASQGRGNDDRPLIVFRSWTLDGSGKSIPVMVDTQTEQQIGQSCKYLPTVQNLTDAAAAALAADNGQQSQRSLWNASHYQA